MDRIGEERRAFGHLASCFALAFNHTTSGDLARLHELANISVVVSKRTFTVQSCPCKGAIV
jgi:hypothetical protein